MEVIANETIMNRNQNDLTLINKNLTYKASTVKEMNL